MSAIPGATKIHVSARYTEAASATAWMKRSVLMLPSASIKWAPTGAGGSPILLRRNASSSSCKQGIHLRILDRGCDVMVPKRALVSPPSLLAFEEI